MVVIAHGDVDSSIEDPSIQDINIDAWTLAIQSNSLKDLIYFSNEMMINFLESSLKENSSDINIKLNIDESITSPDHPFTATNNYFIINDNYHLIEIQEVEYLDAEDIIQTRKTPPNLYSLVELSYENDKIESINVLSVSHIKNSIMDYMLDVQNEYIKKELIIEGGDDPENPNYEHIILIKKGDVLLKKLIVFNQFTNE